MSSLQERRRGSGEGACQPESQSEPGREGGPAAWQPLTPWPGSLSGPDWAAPLPIRGWASRGAEPMGRLGSAGPRAGREGGEAVWSCLGPGAAVGREAELLPRARGMVVVTGREPASRRPDDAMSSSDAEDDFQEPATPTATQAGHALPLLPQEFPEVVPLNIGGMYFTTRLSTLRRYEDTMLAAMFSGRHYIPTDAEGRYFIDRDGTHFGDVLNFLRSGDLPPRDRVRAVYKEAQYYAIGPLLEQLENVQPLKGEKVRQAFLGLMPYYKDHLERIVEIAQLRAVQRKARFAKLKVCVFKEEMPITPYECPLFNSLRFERSESDSPFFEHHCEVDVSFGPWEAVADVYDLLHCLVTDLSAQGLTVDHQCIGVCDKHLVNHYYCKRPIYEFKITW
ncbi:BTB/POZ domain-containing protein KCTD7 isoform X2 [Dromiciops gliroides]|nr:BTB/POZ domain-containing protein KCTD7 isoform X2 [Dromiciops gliroides]